MENSFNSDATGTLKDRIKNKVKDWLEKIKISIILKVLNKKLNLINKINWITVAKKILKFIIKGLIFIISITIVTCLFFDLLGKSYCCINLYSYLDSLFKLSDNYNFAYNNLVKLITYKNLIFLICTIFLFVIIRYLSNEIYKEEIASKTLLNKNLIKYLDNTYKKTFVINGEWGSGKTYALKEFLKSYFKSNRQKIISISCFGVSTKQELENLIKVSYEKNDKTIKAKITLLIRHIPMIGSTLHNLIKPKYDFKYMKEGSIFIFDDFERIAECYQYEDPNQISKYYIEDISSSNKDSEALLKTHIANFKLEMFKINEDVFTKFNTISGVINNLSENYNMKVIVVCNNSKLDLRLFNEIFHNKMSSIVYEFESQATDEVIKSILSTALNSIILNKSIHDALKDFLAQENDNIISLWSCCKIKNLRSLNNIIISFVNVINFLGFDLTKEILGDIFYSIFLKHIKAYYTMSDTLVIYEKLNLADNLFATLSDSFTNCFSVFYNKKNVLEFLKNYLYVGENISNYWHSGLKLNYSEITTDLEYFHKIKKDHLVLKLYESEKDFDIIASVTSVNCFRLEDLAYCLKKISCYWEDDYKPEYFSLNTPDLTPIIENIISSKCIINNNNEISEKEVYNLLHTSSIKGNILYLLRNDFNLLLKLFEKFSNNLNDKLSSNLLENGYDFCYNLIHSDLSHYKSSDYSGPFIYLFDLFGAFLWYPSYEINESRKYDLFKKSLETVEIMLDDNIRKF